jgi:hypothetical protein
MTEELDKVTQEDLVSCVRHIIENSQEEDFGKEIGQDNILELTVINLQNSETEDEESDEGDGGVTGAEGRYDENDDNVDVDIPLAVPLD